MKRPSLFSNYIFSRLFWVCGLIFLVVCSLFGGVSKVFYPSLNGLDLSIGLQRTIGVVQLITAFLLFWKPNRRLGLFLAGCGFLLFAVWVNTSSSSTLILLLIGFSVSCTLYFCEFNFNPPKKEEESHPEELLTGTFSVECDAEVESIEEPKKESLWMDQLDKDDLMDWVFGD